MAHAYYTNMIIKVCGLCYVTLSVHVLGGKLKKEPRAFSYKDDAKIISRLEPWYETVSHLHSHGIQSCLQEGTAYERAKRNRWIAIKKDCPWVYFRKILNVKISSHTKVMSVQARHVVATTVVVKAKTATTHGCYRSRPEVHIPSTDICKWSATIARTGIS